MKHRRLIPVAAALTAALSLLGQPARAATELLANGGFESGLVGWTAHGSFTAAGLYGTYAHSGTHYAASSAAGGLNADLSTLVNVSAGQTYDLSFWLIGGGTGHKEIRVDWGNTVLLDLVDTNLANSYHQYTFTDLAVPANASQVLLKFWSRNDPNSNGIDDVSVVMHATAAVPEPDAAALLAAGLGMVALLARRRQAPGDGAMAAH